MTESSDHIVFAGGGTAGHLFPGLAVAEHLSRCSPGLRITFVGTGKPFELRHVKAAGFQYCGLPSRPFPRRPHEAFRFVADNVNGYYMAKRLLTRQQVSLVVGLGGYASVPTARAAARLGIPFVLFEQNVIPGRATRWLAPRAELICSAFDGIQRHLRSGCRVHVTGNPLRRAFASRKARVRSDNHVAKGQRQLLVLGGSGGARVLNEQVPRALYKAASVLAGWQIVHQSGQRDQAATKELYGKFGLRAVVLPFIDNLPAVLGDSHLAISRAGGTTLAELAASGVPAVLLPYPQATDNHQRRNADAYSIVGACHTLDERELSGRLDNHVARAVVELATDHPLRARMSAAMTRLARPEATERVSRLIGSLLESRPLIAS